MRTALLTCLVLLIAVPAAQATPVKVTWPEQRTYAPGERIAVSVSASRAVKVSIQRVSASGKLMQTLARRSAKRATVAATLANAGTYVVRVGDRRRTLRVVAPAPAPAPAPPAMIDSADCSPPAVPTLTVQLSETSVTPGTALDYTVQNTSAGCIPMGLDYSLEHQQPDGTWAPVPWPIAVPALVVLLRQGEVQPRVAYIRPEAPLGTYRLIQPYATGAAPVFEVVAPA